MLWGLGFRGLGFRRAYWASEVQGSFRDAGRAYKRTSVTVALRAGLELVREAGKVQGAPSKSATLPQPHILKPCEVA